MQATKVSTPQNSIFSDLQNGSFHNYTYRGVTFVDTRVSRRILFVKVELWESVTGETEVTRAAAAAAAAAGVVAILTAGGVTVGDEEAGDGCENKFSSASFL